MLQAMAQDKEIGQQRRTLAHGQPALSGVPERFQAGILWFTSGYVEYNLPNHLLPGQTLTELQISFEISSEYPGFNKDYPSDIHFSLNQTPLGVWVSPGDYGDRKGHISPAWWPGPMCSPAAP